MIMIMTAPAVWSHEPQDVRSAIGQSVDMLCAATGFPDPEVRIEKVTGQCCPPIA